MTLLALTIALLLAGGLIATFCTRWPVVASAIGALSDVVLLYFDWDKKDYVRIPVEDQVEVASLIGDVATDPS